MSKTFFKMGLGLLAAAGMAWPAAAVPVKLHDRVSSVVSHLTSVGQVPTTNTLHLAIGLPLRNQDILDVLLKQVYDPSSQNYHHFLTPAEFTAQFGPTEEDYQKVVHFAQTNGLTVVGGHANRTLVDVVGKVSDIERAFSVNLKTYHHPKENRLFYSPDTEPTVSSGLPILSVVGLNNYSLPRPLIRRHTVPQNPKGRSLVAMGSGPIGNYMGYDFRNAYVPGTSLTGSGQTVALFECDGYFPTDISSYLTQAGLPTVPLVNVLIDGFNGQPSGTGGEVEVALDIDMAICMAPGLSKVIVYEGPNDTPSYDLDILNQIANDNLAKQVSSSWLIGDSIAQYAQIYEQFALQGQSFFQASGDEGAYYPGIFQSEDSPLVTLVGGTTLTTATPGGPWSAETVWNWGFGFAGGGGISTTYSIPSWQTGINMTTNKGSTTMRNIPDVALTADNIFIVGDGSQQLGVGGTSAAAPLWAGYMALVNQQVVSAGKSPIGFVNPSLYSLAQGNNYTNLFHDIITGNNTNYASTNLYYAVPGYDLCSGLGTPNGTNLINALASIASSAPPRISAPLPIWGNTLSVMNGGNPNGDWFLFVMDDKVRDTGLITNGWAVALTTANPVGYAADNAICATPTNQPLAVLVNSHWNLSLAVTNYGPSISTNVVVEDVLPIDSAGISLVSSNATLGSVNLAGTSLTWTLGNLAVNAGGALNLNFYVTSAASFTNTATVIAATADPNSDDDSVTSVINGQAIVPPGLTFSLHGAGGFQFAVSGSAVPTIIQASTNLLKTNWISIYTNTPSPSFVFTNFDFTNYPMRFYRAVTAP